MLMEHGRLYRYRIYCTLLHRPVKHPPSFTARQLQKPSSKLQRDHQVDQGWIICAIRPCAVAIPAWLTKAQGFYSLCCSSKPYDAVFEIRVHTPCKAQRGDSQRMDIM